MSDTITKWHEMEEERKLNENAEQYQKELMPLKSIKILECYHHEFF